MGAIDGVFSSGHEDAIDGFGTMSAESKLSHVNADTIKLI